MKFIISLFCVVVAAQNQPSLQSLIVFGDGYSDIGNTFILTNSNWPQKPYFRGRFTNDQVWSELVSPPLNIPLFMYAYGGSQADHAIQVFNVAKNSATTIPSIVQQMKEFRSVATDKLLRSLVVIFFSGSEFINDDSSNPSHIIRAFRACIYDLLRNGVHNVVLATLPPLDRFPGVHLDRTKQYRLQSVVDTYNKEILSLASFFARRRKVVVWDVHQVFAEILENGPFQVTHKACVHDVPGVPIKQCNNADDYLFWDSVHVTLRMHHLLAKSFIHQVSSSWPGVRVWGDI